AAGPRAGGLLLPRVTSRRFTDEVTGRNVAGGARTAGRHPPEVRLACPVFTIVGDTEAEREEWRQRARFEIAFYGSTPAYAGVFELHGWHGVSEKLHQLQRAGDVTGMAAQITDEMLDVYAITSTWDDFPRRLVEKYHGIAARLIMYFATEAWERGAAMMARWRNAMGRKRELVAAQRWARN